MRVNGILSFLSFCDVCSDDCRSNCCCLHMSLVLVIASLVKTSESITTSSDVFCVSLKIILNTVYLRRVYTTEEKWHGSDKKWNGSNHFCKETVNFYPFR